jgi:hypothetical protein
MLTPDPARHQQLRSLALTEQRPNVVDLRQGLAEALIIIDQLLAVIEEQNGEIARLKMQSNEREVRARMGSC